MNYLFVKASLFMSGMAPLKVDTDNQQINDIFENLDTLLNALVFPALFWALGVVCAILAIIIGIQMAHAKSPEERQQAKSKLIGWGVGLAISLVLSAAVNPLISYIASFFRI